mmetsp:Transcript_30274/g.100270  ORF Transcript_30274/g.100270 Transcript_30274/m.100270 type:complete len:283 (+) Transcript_30274:1586-2434(+)
MRETILATERPTRLKTTAAACSATPEPPVPGTTAATRLLALSLPPGVAVSLRSPTSGCSGFCSALASSLRFSSSAAAGRWSARPRAPSRSSQPSRPSYWCAGSPLPALLPMSFLARRAPSSSAACLARPPSSLLPQPARLSRRSPRCLCWASAAAPLALCSSRFRCKSSRSLRSSPRPPSSPTTCGRSTTWLPTRSRPSRALARGATTGGWARRCCPRSRASRAAPISCAAATPASIRWPWPTAPLRHPPASRQLRAARPTSRPSSPTRLRPSFAATSPAPR